MAIPALRRMGGTGWSLQNCACAASPTLAENALLVEGFWQVICHRCGRRGAVSQSDWMAVELWNQDRKLQQQAPANPTGVEPPARELLVELDGEGK